MTTTNQTVACEVPVSDEFLTDCVVTAVEGGINYWATVREYDHSGLSFRGSETDVERVYAYVSENESEEFGVGFLAKNLLNTEAILRGLRRIVGQTDDDPYTGNEVRLLILGAIMRDDAGEIDAPVADVIAQVALLGEVRYG